MFKNKNLKLILIIIQTFMAYLLSVYILNNGINLSVMFKIDIFLFILIWLISFFILCHLIVPLKNLYDWLFKKRFMLGLLLFLLLVLGKFNGSSYGMWNTYIEPNYPVSSLNSIMAPIRAIRSDEWLVNSPHVLSEFDNNFAYYNSFSRSVPTDMFTTLPVPIKSIMIVTKPFLIGYLFLGKDYGMSFYWWGRLIVLFLVTFEFFRIFTKDNRKLSLLGTILVTFSPAIFWWYSQYLVEQLIGGNLAIIMFYHLLHSKEKKKKILYSVGIGLGFLIFFFTLYPAWLIPLGYFYLILALYILYEYHKLEKIKLKDLAYLLIPISIFLVFLIIFFMKSYDTYKIISSTIYPGGRISLGNEGFANLFYYPLSILFPYLNMNNPCEASTFYSFFPFSLILAVYLIIKNRKDNILLISLTILVTLFILVTILPIPSILAKLTLLSRVPGTRLAVIISYILVFITILVLNKINLTKNSKNILFVLSVIIAFGVTYYGYKLILPNYSIKVFLLGSFALLVIFGLMIFKKENLLLLSITLLCLLATIWVNPLMKGFSGIYEKPLAKELENYQDENKKWLVLDNFVIPNYFLANGLKVINSTNVYPNMDFYHLLDKDLKYEDVYNRYAHLEVTLTDDETSFSNSGEDLVRLNLNNNDLCKLDVDYLGSLTDVSKFANQNVSFEEMYHLDNVYLYQVLCS